MAPPNPSSEIPPPAVMPPLGPWLEAYVRGDQQAFTQLVGNTTPLVMAAALRRCGGWHALAQEAAQVVYLDLARRAPSLRADATLTGWLHQRATREAGDLMKQELRRMVREQLQFARLVLDYHVFRPTCSRNIPKGQSLQGGSFA